MPYGNPAKRIYDYTTLSQWLLCQRRYYWYGVRNLVLDVPAPAPAFGAAIHAGVAEWYATHDVDKAQEAFRQSYRGAPPDLLRTEAKGELIIAGYARKWPQPEPFKVLANEVEFALPMPDGSTYTGRIDRVIDWGGRILVQETKTTSSGVGAHFFKQFSPNLQIDGYCYAVATDPRWGRCDGAVIDAIAVLKTKEDYGRDLHDRSPAQIAAFARLYQRIVADIERTAAQAGQDREGYIQNKLMCTYYGECPYRRLCLFENDGLIEGHYKPREILTQSTTLGEVIGE